MVHQVLLVKNMVSILIQIAIITSLIFQIPNGNEPIFYYYGITTPTIIENQTLSWAGSGSTNLGRIVLINCSNFTIRNNTISGGIGQNGETGLYCGDWGVPGSPGSPGGTGSGVYLRSSNNGVISDNIIFNNIGGRGGTGAGFGRGGPGGIGQGICLSSSTNITISNNTIFNNTGGQGGQSGFGAQGGQGGEGYGIYLSSSLGCNISKNTVSDNQGGQRGSAGPHGSYGIYGYGYGVYSCSSSTSEIHYNTFSGNKNGDATKGYGAYHDGSLGTISTTLNWWSHNSGPYHGTSNPTGIGDMVSDWVDYNPWLTSIITIVPSSGLIGTIITVNGQYFATQTEVSLSFGTHLTITTTQSSINGTFSATFIVPTQASGTKVITAIDSFGNLATTTFFILPQIQINPSSAVSGAQITIQGSGFSVQSVSISFGTSLTITTTQTNINGTFSCTFTVPAQPYGTKIITATDIFGNQATTTFFILPKIFQLHPSSGLANTSVTIEGSGFRVQGSVFIDFGTHLTITTTTSSANGTFSAIFIVPTQLPGTKIITATDSFGNFAVTTFILLPPTFLKIVPAYNLIAKNQEFDVDVGIEDVRNLKGAEVHLSFDSDVLQVLELTNGPFPSGDRGIIKGT
ncbi:MAG: right-handed parallel beta-helix repeat-containing protein, partial [bacterium]|nr:right-handed parallel beta-helix repeat-containing protein [bacterium]